MAAKSKKRLSKIENKLLKLEKLDLEDVICSICQSILTEPVTLPCFHDFCQHCFNGTIENNALCCPLCRLRIGSWLRTATKQKNLVNVELWNFIKTKFSREIDIKTNGGDISVPEEKSTLRLSKPGEIRSEYEAELERLRAERLRLEEKHIQETELLIRKIQEEEEEAHRKYLECLKKDEMLAQQMQHEHVKSSALPHNAPSRGSQRGSTKISRLRTIKIDSYLSNVRQASSDKDSPSLSNSSKGGRDESISKKSTPKQINGASPEMVPSYGKSLKNFIDKKNCSISELWNKENGERHKEKVEDTKCHSKDIDNADDKSKPKHKSLVPSLLVSLPLPCTGIRPQKHTAPENRKIETGSVDSMHQELCYFKPIEGTTPTIRSLRKGLPLRVPGLRMQRESTSPHYENPPSRAQYLDGLCRLRNFSIATNMPSAFVIAVNVLKVQEENPAKCETHVKSKVKKTSSVSPNVIPSLPAKKNSIKNKTSPQVNGLTKLNKNTNLRRTQSMGNITKNDNETTPKKAKVKQRKISTERKPYLRSDTKRNNTRQQLSPPPFSESINYNKVNLAVKNLSSPLKNCDVKKLLDEQIRIEKLIEQEKSDLELARKVDAEWNGRRQRRAAGKRQAPVHDMRPAKKIKV